MGSTEGKAMFNVKMFLCLLVASITFGTIPDPLESAPRHVSTLVSAVIAA